MKLVFLKSSAADLTWMRRYYRNVFSASSTAAKGQYKKTTQLIRENPYIGEPSEGFENTREFPILRTPFSIVYRIQKDRIEVLRIIDNRSDWASKSG